MLRARPRRSNSPRGRLPPLNEFRRRILRIGPPRPDVTFVDVGVHIDKARQRDAVANIDHWKVRDRTRTRRFERCDTARIDQDIAACDPFRVSVDRQFRSEVDRHPRVGDPVAIRERTVTKLRGMYVLRTQLWA